MWQQWTNVILGAWIIAIPFVGFTGSALVWALVLTGAVTAVLGIWGAQETQTERETGRMVHGMQR